MSTIKLKEKPDLKIIYRDGIEEENLQGHIGFEDESSLSLLRFWKLSLFWEK